MDANTTPVPTPPQVSDGLVTVTTGFWDVLKVSGPYVVVFFILAAVTAYAIYAITSYYMKKLTVQQEGIRAQEIATLRAEMATISKDAAGDTGVLTDAIVRIVEENARTTESLRDTVQQLATGVSRLTTKIDESSDESRRLSTAMETMASQVGQLVVAYAKAPPCTLAADGDAEPHPKPPTKAHARSRARTPTAA